MSYHCYCLIQNTSSDRECIFMIFLTQFKVCGWTFIKHYILGIFLSCFPGQNVVHPLIHKNVVHPLIHNTLASISFQSKIQKFHSLSSAICGTMQCFPLFLLLIISILSHHHHHPHIIMKGCSLPARAMHKCVKIFDLQEGIRDFVTQIECIRQLTLWINRD